LEGLLEVLEIAHFFVQHCNEKCAVGPKIGL